MPPDREKRWTIHQIGVNKDGSPQLTVDGPGYDESWRQEIDDWPKIEVLPASSLLEARQRVEEIRRIVDEQAEDEALWARSGSIVEAYIQHELRRLHAAVEGISQEDAARATLQDTGGAE